eukprot:1358595-Amorphochlora_amoeboformis.AAC.2
MVLWSEVLLLSLALASSSSIRRPCGQPLVERISKISRRIDRIGRDVAIMASKREGRKNKRGARGDPAGSEAQLAYEMVERKRKELEVIITLRITIDERLDMEKDI